MSKVITFVIDGDGDVHYEMGGFQGDACFATAEQLIEELARLGLSLEVSEVQRKEGDERVELTTNRPLSA